MARQNFTPEDDRINTPYIDLEKPEAQAEIAAFRIKRLEQTVDKQGEDISTTRETVVEVATTVKEMAKDFKEIRTSVHPCSQTAAIAEVQATQKQLVKASESSKSRRWSLLVAIFTLVVGLGATASSGFVWGGRIEESLENEAETREKDISRVETHLKTLPSKEAIRQLATKEDVNQLRVEVLQRGSDTGQWFEELDRRNKRRFCKSLNERAYSELPMSVRGGCREHR